MSSSTQSKEIARLKAENKALRFRIQRTRGYIAQAAVSLRAARGYTPKNHEHDDAEWLREWLGYAREEVRQAGRAVKGWAAK